MKGTIFSRNESNSQDATFRHDSNKFPNCNGFLKIATKGIHKLPNTIFGCKVHHFVHKILWLVVCFSEEWKLVSIPHISFYWKSFVLSLNFDRNTKLVLLNALQHHWMLSKDQATDNKSWKCLPFFLLFPRAHTSQHTWMKTDFRAYKYEIQC